MREAIALLASYVDMPLGLVGQVHSHQKYGTCIRKWIQVRLLFVALTSYSLGLQRKFNEENGTDATFGFCQL